MKIQIRYCVIFTIVFISAFIFSSASAQQACELYTKSDAQSLLSEDNMDVRTRKAMMPAGDICQYIFKKNGDTFGIAIKLSTSRDIKDEGIHDSAMDVFTRQKKARLASDYASRSFQAIQGLGDDAFWNGKDLWILKGDALVVITANAFLKGSFKSSEAAAGAKSEQSLVMSQKAAGVILPRMK